MKANSIKGNSPEEIRSALAKKMEEGFKPTLATVFISRKQDHKAVTKILSDAGVSIFGASTNGEFIDGDTGMGAIVLQC
ncbi:hypothetical protein LZZ85_03325 [Terrimonas sp. NA20]|uniref:FIST domain-containing protein n=1 Tax=Terrimonas ginsenosidimutans TaxID=2908004 RepID=A0ABS9KLZ6_9BACT|nr:hypothetical protein [Terrimonas ginsenosidimutans]MCG2613290.1 hypothetical protein [Terrimonas ginsenosidimutans]